MRYRKNTLSFVTVAVVTLDSNVIAGFINSRLQHQRRTKVLSCYWVLQLVFCEPNRWQNNRNSSFCVTCICKLEIVQECANCDSLTNILGLLESFRNVCIKHSICKHNWWFSVNCMAGTGRRSEGILNMLGRRGAC